MIDIWENCYIETWKSFIVDEAFSHPAKFSHSLIGKIYDHALKNGWIKKGDTVLDPFAGVALGALHSLINGLNWIGIELEKKFVNLGQQNINLWNQKFRNWSQLGTARIIQGDSRRIKEMVSKAGIIISSPPFMAQERGAGPAKPDAIYIGNGHRLGANQGYQNQVFTSGNLANMKEGSFDLCVSSPPYEEIPGHGGKPTQIDLKKSTGGDLQKYGNTEGQLADSNTFWESSKIIVQECYELLKSGSHAIWVCKDYIKAGKRVPFSGRWLALCESVGFKLICIHRAMLIQNYGIQKRMFEEDEEISIERKSFFRRLAEKKGSPRIDWEDVICFEKLENTSRIP